jgi:hypothetical protein
MGCRSVAREWKLLRQRKRLFFTRSQIFLKKAGPNPSGPGLELSFMEKRVSRISEREKGLMSVSA